MATPPSGFNFGNRLAELRKTAEMSQADLANSIGVSQASISRFEGTEKTPTDVKFLLKIAVALNVSLGELVPQEFLQELLPEPTDEMFFAFCPNPFCSRNERGLGQDAPFVRWKSSKKYDLALFPRINFCVKCGNELIKACSKCGWKLDDNWVIYCLVCGNKICDRPNDEEWRRITMEAKPSVEPSGDEEIPF